MPAIIDPQTINVDDLPGIWSPVQWELTPEEKAEELEQQAIASLLWSVDTPETILRLLLNETDIERAYEPPKAFDSEQQGDWDYDILTFEFKRSIKLEHVVREQDYLYVEYNFGELGYWSFEIEPDQVKISKL
jgi:hypothetical protein